MEMGQGTVALRLSTAIRRTSSECQPVSPIRGAWHLPRIRVSHHGEMGRGGVLPTVTSACRGWRRIEAELEVVAVTAEVQVRAARRGRPERRALQAAWAQPAPVPAVP